MTEDCKNGGSSWLTAGRFAALLSLLICSEHLDVILGWKTFYRGDYAVFGYPLAYFQRESFWRGELPLWNPYNFCGLPFMAQWNTMVFYPPALLYLLLPLTWALGMFNLLHLLWGGVGMFVLVRQWTRNGWAGGVAGVAFALSGPILNGLIWPSNGATLAWMPWVIWAVERALAGGVRPLLRAVGIGAMQMLTGSPETILFTWLIVGVSLLVEIRRNHEPGGRMAGRLLAMIALIAGLCAVQLLPFLELLRWSSRSPVSGADGSMPWSGLANYFIPVFHCWYQNGRFGQIGQPWINSFYAGVAILVLAAAGLLREKNWRVWLYGGLALLGGWLALGSNARLYPWLNRVFPSLGFMNFPVKFIMLPAFLLPALAGLTVARIWAADAPERARWGRALWRGAGFSATVIFALLLWEKNAPFLPAAWPPIFQNACWRLLFLVLILGAVFWVARTRKPLAGLALLLLLGVDGLTHLPAQNPTTDYGIYTPNLSRDDLPASPPLGQARVCLNPDMVQQFTQNHLANTSANLLVRRVMLFRNLNLLDSFPTTAGFFPMLPLKFSEMNYYFLQANPQKSAPFFNFLGITHLSDTNQNALSWNQRSGAQPWVTCGQKPVFADSTDTLRGIFATNYAPQSVVYLPPEIKTEVRAQGNGICHLQQMRIEHHRLTLETVADTPSLVVLAQTWFPAWQAFVDGKEVPLWVANYAFQALEVPAGRHQVAVVYRGRSLLWGAGISLATAGLCCGIGWTSRHRRKPPAVPTFVSDEAAPSS